jgi:hypothetical protein
LIRLKILEDTAVVKSVLVMFWLKVGGMGREQKRERAILVSLCWF